MSTSDGPEVPWIEPTAEVPATEPPTRRRLVLLLAPVLGLLILCCAGATLVKSFLHGDSKPDAGPTLVVPPSTAPTPSPSRPPSTSPTPTRTTTPTTRPPSPSPRPTTRRPTPASPRPTTARPPTTPVIQQNVRAGERCSPAGALGLTRRGRVLRCGPSLGNPQNRWRVPLQPID